MTLAKKTYTIKVTGRVQGVGFRYYTRQEATRLNLVGSVTNLSDGSVEIKVQGPTSVVYAFIDWCRMGPSAALVEGLDYRSVDEMADNSFEIIR